VTIRTPRAIHRGYVSGGRRAGQVRRLHIVREDGPPGWQPGTQTLCGQGAWSVTRSDAVVIDPIPARPPDGLRWCPKCVGHLAEVLGLLDDIAGEIAGYDPALIDLREDRWWAYVDEQREVRRAAMQGGAR
jgi:hypothetical protein